MKLSRTVLSVAILAVAALFFAVPARSFADTYQLAPLGIDNTQFYGMDDLGHVVVYSSFLSCGDPSTGCYTTFLNGASAGTSDTVPNFSWDFTKGACTAPPCFITYNGRTASIVSDPVSQLDLFAAYGPNPPQFLVKGGLGAIFAINGLGDIVFDNQTSDEWYEAIDLSTAPVPEPGSIFLLATGLLALAVLLYRRKTAASLPLTT